MCVCAQEEGKSSSKDEMEARLKDVGSTTKGRLVAAINSPEVAKQMAQEAAQKRIEELKAKIARYESEPEKGEGKRELLAKARALEAERDEAKLHSPWLTFAGMSLQFAIVLLSASILAVSTKMFKWSIAVSAFGAVLLSQGIWLWLPLTL